MPAKILFDTRFNDVTPFEARLATDSADYDGWQPSIATGNSATVTGDTGAADYCYVLGELDGCSVTFSVDGSPVATLIEGNSLALFPEYSGQWSATVNNDTGSTRTPFIRVLMAGLSMPISQPEIGFKSPLLNRDTRTVSNISESGYFLGRSVRQRASLFDITSRRMSSEFAHNQWLAFLRHAETKPFIYYLDSGSRKDVVYSWTIGKAGNGTYSACNKLEQDISVRGKPYEGLTPAAALAPSVGITDGAANEDAQVVRFTISRTGDPSQSFAVNWATTDATALAGTDYEAASGVAQFGPGDSEVIIEVPLINRAGNQPSRYFYVDLSNSTGPDILRGRAVGNIFEATQGSSDGGGSVTLYSVYSGVSSDPALTDVTPLTARARPSYEYIDDLDATGGNYLYFAWPASLGGGAAEFLVFGRSTTFGHQQAGGFSYGQPRLITAEGKSYYLWRSENLLHGENIDVQVRANSGDS